MSLTRARSPSSKNGLPDLRLLPDAPVPDSRTVLTNPDTIGIEAVEGHEKHPPSFIRDTNTIEALHRQIRKTIKTRGPFPTEEAARKLIYLSIINAKKKWRQTYNWSAALLSFKIHFEDRLP